MLSEGVKQKVMHSTKLAFGQPQFLALLEHPSKISQVLTSFIIQANENAHHIWRLIGFLLLLLLIYNYWAKLRGVDKGVGSERVFLLISAASLFIIRYPTYAASEINPDEAEWIAGAATLMHNPGFWLSVDGTTSGPLNIYPLCLISLFNISLSYASARIFCIIALVIPAMVFTYYSLKIFFTELIARAALLPFVIFYALTSLYDLSFYSSEYVSALLISIVLYLYARFNSNPVVPTMALAGLVLGLLPLAKFQSLPIGFVLGLFLVINVLANRQDSLNLKIKKLLVLFGSALVPTGITLLYLFSADAYEHFWQSYILNNLTYGSIVTLKALLTALPAIIWKYSKDALPYYLLVALIAAAGFLVLFKNRSQIRIGSLKLFLLSHLLFLAAYYAIGKGWGFPHYQVFVFTPVILITACYLDILTSYAGYAGLGPHKLLTALCVLLVAVMMLPDNAIVSKVLAERDNPPKNSISSRILKYAQPQDKLVVWGFQNILNTNGTYYLETGLIQGTRESHSQRPEGRLGTPEQVRYYQGRFLQDIKASKPVAILDISEADINNNFYPELKDYVAREYRLDTVTYRQQAGRDASSRIILEPKLLSSKLYVIKR